MVRAITLRRLAARLAVILPFAALLYTPSPALAGPILDPILAKYAVLAYTPVTCVPTCNIGGDVGSSSADTTAAFNFLFGGTGIDNGNAGTAQTKLTNAVNAVAAFGVTATIADGDLDAYQNSLVGHTIPPGTYDVGAIGNLVGTLKLDGLGSNTAVWAFRFADSLVTGDSSNVIVQNVGDGAGVGLYWTTVHSATINGPTFAGNVMAGSSISSNGDLTLSCGRLLAQTAAVTLIGDTISIDTCLSGGSDQAGNGPVGAPEPSTLLLLAGGLVGVAAWMRRVRAR